jgi:hypothetical protein
MRKDELVDTFMQCCVYDKEDFMSTLKDHQNMHHYTSMLGRKHWILP